MVWTAAHVDDLETAMRRQYNPRLLVEALTDLIRDEHETYHEGRIGECDAPLCRAFFNIAARLSA